MLSKHRYGFLRRLSRFGTVVLLLLACPAILGLAFEASHEQNNITLLGRDVHPCLPPRSARVFIRHLVLDAYATVESIDSLVHMAGATINFQNLQSVTVKILGHPPRDLLEDVTAAMA